MQRCLERGARLAILVPQHESTSPGCTSRTVSGIGLLPLRVASQRIGLSKTKAAIHSVQALGWGAFDVVAQSDVQRQTWIDFVIILKIKGVIAPAIRQLWHVLDDPARRRTQ